MRNRCNAWFSRISGTSFRVSIVCALLAAVGCTTTSSTGQVSLPSPGSDPALQVRGQNDVTDDWSNFINPRAMVNKLKTAAGYGPDRELAKQAFADGERLFLEASSVKDDSRKKLFEDAAKKYKLAVNRWPNSTLEEDALFMLSESQFFADDYPAATKAYEQLVNGYPNTRHMDVIDKRRFAIARYWVQHHEKDPDLPITPNLTSKDQPVFDKFGNAMRVFNKIRLDDPTGKLADDATMAAGVSHFKDENWQLADEMFTDLRRAFPDSEHQFQAHLLGLECKRKLYQGSDYSLQPMDEAEELIRQIYRQFPKESREHHEYLTKTWRSIRLDKAEHDWSMAEYYDKRDEVAAARQYYSRIREDYSDTSLAKEATERIAALPDTGEEESQAMSWLARMFPTPERDKPLVARNPLDAIRR
ncbi:MAG: hypothetical protein CMJ80_09435 [Planctomycetaceae bacterium]|nr:hypothetical protein [Planctomycetaceae bacterium]